VAGALESAETGGCFYVEDFGEADQSECTSSYKIWLLRLLGQDLFVGDAIKFVEKFKRPIAEYAAHIYISALGGECLHTGYRSGLNQNINLGVLAN
jgi:hypothetical protein